MKGKLKTAWGYQGDAMNLPVADSEDAGKYYERTMNFRIESIDKTPFNSVTLERDGVRMRLVENGGDSSQDGCAFSVEDIGALFEEFKSNGWSPPEKPEGNFSIEQHEDGPWKVFFVLAPDGLCFWFGEKVEDEK
jgi:lactoylglutathione lyase